MSSQGRNSVTAAWNYLADFLGGWSKGIGTFADHIATFISQLNNY